MALFLKNVDKKLKMKSPLRFIGTVLIIFILAGCSKKVHPSQNPGITVISGVSTDSAKVIAEKEVVVEKVAAPVAKKPKTVFPNSITVNDLAAKKSTDGRHYYDVQGHRYWKNYKDGKYYLYNKSMYNNPDFKNPDYK